MKFYTPITISSLISAMVASCTTTTASRDDQETSSDLQASCSQICDKFDLCDSRVDQTDCAEDCSENTGMSATAQRSLAICVDRASCDEVAAESYWTCVSDALRALPVPSAGSSACAAAAAKADECVGSAADEVQIASDCERITGKLFSDACFNDARVCFESEPCDRVEDCMGDVAARYHTGIDAEMFVGAVTARGEWENEPSDEGECVEDWGEGCSAEHPCCSSDFDCYEGYCFTLQED